MSTRKRLNEPQTNTKPHVDPPTKKTIETAATADTEQGSENRATAATRDSVSRNWHNLDNRLSIIAETAYFKAQKRGFEHGHEESDWLEAEQEFAKIMGEL